MSEEYLSIETTVNAPLQKAWDAYTKPEFITQWNFANDEWCCPSASNDLRAGGKMISRMEAKDGSMGFDFSATYTEVKAPTSLAYTLDDGRKVKVEFIAEGNSTKIQGAFQPEQMHPKEFQQAGWQAILNNYKKFVEEKLS